MTKSQQRQRFSITYPVVVGKEGPNETLNEMAHSIAHDSQNLATKGFWHKVIGSKNGRNIRNKMDHNM